MIEPQALPSDPAADASQPSDDLWRAEIPARVAGYNHRRGRRITGAFSMRFPFPPAEPEESPAAPEEEIGEGDAVLLGAEDGCQAAAVSLAEVAETMEPLPVSPEAAAVAIEQPATASAPPVPLHDADSCVPDFAAEPDPPLAP